MRIGNLECSGNVFLAPMAGITDPPFRRLVQRFGISAVWTEMLSAHGVFAASKKARTMELEGHAVPTVFQIYGREPEALGAAAGYLQDCGAAVIDINMGCPARRIVGKGSGAALMNDPDLVERITAAVRQAVTIPVTVKIRSGWDESRKNAPLIARVIEQAGADAVIVHCRSRSQVHSGPPSLEILQEVKQTVTIPVIGNGGIRTAADAATMLEKTQCDGIMIGRGVLGRPWFPGTLLGSVRTSLEEAPTFTSVIERHFQDQLTFWDELTGVRRMRRHLAWYSKGFPEATEFRQLVFREDKAETVLRMVHDFFGKARIA